MGNVIVLVILAVVLFFCIRSIVRSRKNSSCTGNCGSCGGCGPQPPKKRK